MTQDQNRDQTQDHTVADRPRLVRRRTSTFLKALPLVAGLALSVLLFMDASFADEEALPPQPAPPAGAEDAADEPPHAGPRGPERPQPPAKEDLPETLWDLLRGKYDKNADGVITPQEYTRSDKAFLASDRNGDGVLTSADYRRPRFQHRMPQHGPRGMAGGPHRPQRGAQQAPAGPGPRGDERGPRMRHRRGPQGAAGQPGAAGRPPMGGPHGAAGPRGEDCGCDPRGGRHPQRGGPMGPPPRHTDMRPPMGPGALPPSGPAGAGAPPRPEHAPRHLPAGGARDE